MMLPILISSVVALAIVVERFWTLRPSKLSPPDTLNQVRGWLSTVRLRSRRRMLVWYQRQMVTQTILD